MTTSTHSNNNSSMDFEILQSRGDLTIQNSFNSTKVESHTLGPFYASPEQIRNLDDSFSLLEKIIYLKGTDAFERISSKIMNKFNISYKNRIGNLKSIPNHLKEKIYEADMPTYNYKFAKANKRILFELFLEPNLEACLIPKRFIENYSKEPKENSDALNNFSITANFYKELEEDTDSLLRRYSPRNCEEFSDDDESENVDIGIIYPTRRTYKLEEFSDDDEPEHV